MRCCRGDSHSVAHHGDGDHRRVPRAEASTGKAHARAVEADASWSGHGNIQTDSFEMEAGNWRVKWETHNAKDPQAGVFRVDVHSAISGRPLETAVEHRGDGRDIAYIDEDPRVFFLVIDSKDLEWSVTVEEPLIEDIASYNGHPPAAPK